MTHTDQQDWVRAAPSDVLHAVVALLVTAVVLLIGRFFDETIVAGTAQVLGGFRKFPDWLIEAISVLGNVLLVVLGTAGLIIGLTRRHWRLVTMAGCAAGLAAALTALVNPAIDATARLLPDSDLDVTVGRVPSAALLAAVTATVVVVSTSLPRRWRRAAWVLVVAMVLLRFLGEPLSLDALISTLLGWSVASAVVLVGGAPSRRPTASSVLSGLAQVGLQLDDLVPASVDARGSTPYFAHDDSGRRYFVKVLGGDERSADLLFRVWRFLQPRNFGDQRPFSSLRRGVEHEALVAVMARQFGVRTPRVVGLGTAEPNGVVLAYEAIAGRSLDQLPPGELTDEVLGQAWRQLAVLREHRIAHRDLRLANIFLGDDGTLFLIDFGFSELAAEELLIQTDLVELLTSSATIVGVDRAVRAAAQVIDADELATVLPWLVTSRLSGATRSAIKELPGRMDELTDAVARAATDSGPVGSRGRSPHAG